MYKCSSCGQSLDPRLYCERCDHFDIKAKKQKISDDQKRTLCLEIVKRTKNFGDISPDEEKALAKVVSLATHREKKEIDRFYEAVDKLTDHLKDDP